MYEALQIDSAAAVCHGGGPAQASAPPLRMPTDVELMQRAQSGDTEAFAAIYDRHAGALLALAQRMLGGEALDLLHDVFLEAWQEVRSYDPSRATPRTWLLVRLRSRDGVHFLREGNNKLAGLVMAAINQDIDAAAAAEPTEPSEPTPEAAVSETPPGSGLTGSERLAQADAKGDFAGALPPPSDPAMAQLAKTAKPGTDAARLFSRGEAVAAKPGRFDDVSPPQ